MKRKLVLRSATSFCLAFAAQAYSSDLTIKVSGIKSPQGMVGCTLYSKPDGFPLDGSKGIQQWVKADRSGVTFSYKDLVSGTYAAAISHDLNDNRSTDTNFVGMPTEDWGVSNNVHPSFRPPTFDEAKFEVSADKAIEVRIYQ